MTTDNLTAMVLQVLQSLLFMLVTIWVLLSLLLYLFQPKFIYLPMSELASTPAQIGLDYEDVALTTSDKVSLHGWYVPHTAARATLLFLHGNGGNISHRLDKLWIYHQLGLSVFIIDYRGYGQSLGAPSEHGTYADAEAAWHYLTRNKSIPAQDIIVYGESLGGAVAAWLTNQYAVGTLIIESSFTSITDIGRHYYPYLPVSILARIRYPVVDYLRNSDTPVLIIHSPTDDIVPFSHGQALYQAANEPKTFLEISGDHNSGFYTSGENYTNGLDQFISTHINDIR